MYATLIFYCFKLEAVLRDSMSMLRPFSLYFKFKTVLGDEM